MNAIIIDDEAPVRNSIKTLLNEKYPEINILASVGSVEEGYDAILKHKPDLLFLDIELPDGTGFDLLKKFSQISFRIIFITGHHEYAIDAIRISALDYILKPVDLDEFCSAVEKAYKVVSKEEQQLKFQALIENIQNKKTLKRIILHTADHLHIIPVSEIIRAEADSNYTKFFLSGGKKIMVSRTIKEFDSLLSHSGMLRTHQSHLVNIEFIDKYAKKDGGYLLLKDGTKIPVSPNLKKQVLQSLNKRLYE